MKKDYIYHHNETNKTKIGAKIYDAKKKLKHMKRHKFNDNLRTIYAMIQLTKQTSDSLQYINKIRINPKIQTDSPYKIQRSDLEFYIPQLISQYFRQDLKPQNEKSFEQFLVQACSKNIFFAHKVWFYIEASLINK